MKTLLRNLKIVLVFFIIITIALSGGLVVQLYRSQNRLYAAAGENKAALRARYAQAGRIWSSDGIVLAQSIDGQRSYSEDQALAIDMLHIVGDYTHNIDQTIEARYQRALFGTDRSFFHQLLLDLRGRGLAGDDIVLTLDSRLTRLASQKLAGRRGAVVMLNYQTGAVLVALSQPGTSPESVISWQDIPDTTLFNRALQGQYAPGSTFKLITAAAWIQAARADPDHQVICEGHSTVGADGADEANGGHGLVELNQAFSRSCNVFFGEIGAELGHDNLLEAAGQFGIGSNLQIGRINIGRSLISSPDDPELLSWLAIGQPVGSVRLVLTPLKMALIAGSIAHQGQMIQPQLIDHMLDPTGQVHSRMHTQIHRQTVDAAAALQLDQLMKLAVKEGTGQAAAVPGFTIGGKTGTVQIEDQANNALFIGYIADHSLPLAIAVVIEEGGSGAQTAAPLAGELFAAAARLN